MKKTWAISVFTALLFLLASCGTKTESNDWQQKLRQAAELGTVQYTVQKVISNSDESWQLLGNRKVLFSFKAIIKAGIDMEKFNPELVSISENKNQKTRSISVELPQPEIFSYNIRPDDVKMIYNQVSVFRTEYTNQERDAIVARGEMELKNDEELTQMILKDARQNASTFFEMLLRQNGFNNVTITFKEGKENEINK